MSSDSPIENLRREQGAAIAMPSEPRISVVVPTKNESRNLPFVFERMPADVHEIIVVDGYSKDDTREVALALDDRVRVVEQSRPGKGNALAHGFREVTGDVIVMLDADCSADAAEIPAFVEALRAGADFAKGSRYAAGGGSEDLTRLRSTGNRVLTTTVNTLFGTSYTDLCYGYNAFWTHCLPHISIDCDGFEVETMMNIRIAKARLSVTEVPSYEWERRYGHSNLRVWRDGWRVQRTIMREFATRKRAEGVLPERRAHHRGGSVDGAFERRAALRCATSGD